MEVARVERAVRVAGRRAAGREGGAQGGKKIKRRKTRKHAHLVVEGGLAAGRKVERRPVREERELGAAEPEAARRGLRDVQRAAQRLRLAERDDGEEAAGRAQRDGGELRARDPPELGEVRVAATAAPARHESTVATAAADAAAAAGQEREIVEQRRTTARSRAHAAQRHAAQGHAAQLRRAQLGRGVDVDGGQRVEQLLRAQFSKWVCGVGGDEQERGKVVRGYSRGVRVLRVGPMCSKG